MHRLSGIEIREKFLNGEYTAEEIVQFFLARIEKYDGKIQAFLSVFKESSLEKARQLDLKKKEGKPLGKLAAIPIALKDNIHKKGTLSTCGSQFLKNYKAPFDATVTRLIEEEDGIIIGKTNLDEFAMGSSTENSSFHPTFNPWNLACVPGGSSGGSGAAVAARLVPIALGSDTGGSVRLPAAFCGVVGFKPTYGRISRYGLVAYASSLDQIGPLATTVQDIALMMEVLGKPDPHDATTLSEPQADILVHQETMKGKKMGVPWAFLENLHSEAKTNFLASIDLMRAQGAEIIEVDLNILKYAIAVYYIIACAEASTNLARFDGIRYGKRSEAAKTLDEVYEFSKKEGFGLEVKKRIMLGTYVLSSGYKEAYYKKANKVRFKIIEAFQTAFTKCDVIATPVSPLAAFEKGSILDPLQMYFQDIYTLAVNLAHLCAISVPNGLSSAATPFGLQLIGAKQKDGFLCQMAYLFEKHFSFARKIPPGFD